MDLVFCRFHAVYSGTGVSHKVSKLAENKTYKFRLCASNEAGQGPFSTTYEFKTAYAHPPAIKGESLVSRRDQITKEFIV